MREYRSYFTLTMKKEKKMDYNNVSIDMGNIGKLTSELKAIERDMNYILNLNKDQLYRT